MSSGRSARPAARAPSAHPGGFTLLELLISLSILAVLMAGLFFSLGTTGSYSRRLVDRFERQYDVRLALRRLAADVEGFYLPPGEKNPLFRGEHSSEPGASGRLEFLAFLPPWEEDEKTGDLALVGYSLQPDPGGRGNLLVRHSRPWALLNSEAKPRQAVVLEGVREFRLRFLDGDGRESEKWPPAAPSEREHLVPAAVRVILLLERPGEAPERISTTLSVPAGFQLAVQPGKPEGTGLVPPPPPAPAGVKE